MIFIWTYLNINIKIRMNCFILNFYPILRTLRIMHADWFNINLYLRLLFLMFLNSCLLGIVIFLIVERWIILIVFRCGIFLIFLPRTKHGAGLFDHLMKIIHRLFDLVHSEGWWCLGVEIGGVVGVMEHVKFYCKNLYIFMIDYRDYGIYKTLKYLIKLWIINGERT